MLPVDPQGFAAQCMPDTSTNFLKKFSNNHPIVQQPFAKTFGDIPATLFLFTALHFVKNICIFLVFIKSNVYVCKQNLLL